MCKVFKRVSLKLWKELRSQGTYSISTLTMLEVKKVKAKNAKISEKNNFRIMKKSHAHLQTDIKLWVKFQKDWLKTVGGVALTRKQGRNGFLRCSNCNSSKSRQARVMVLEFCTLSHSALHLCEVSWKYFKWFSSYRANTKTWQMDRLREKLCLPNPSRGDIIIRSLSFLLLTTYISCIAGKPNIRVLQPMKIYTSPWILWKKISIVHVPWLKAKGSL